MEDLSKLELRIPQFIQEDYPQFANFVKAYYEWSSQDSNGLGKGRLIHKWKDIDESIDEFTNYYANQYLEDFPREMVASKRRVIKHSKEFYRSKGSEKSITGLFGILYGDNPSLAFPKDQVFRSSDAKWDSVTTIKTSTTSLRLQEIVGKEIIGVTSKARAQVESYVTAFFGTYQYAEITLSHINGEFLPNEQINVTLSDGFIVQETIYPVIQSITINNPGLNYIKDTYVPVTGGDGAYISCKIAEVSRGGFQSLTITNGGINYQPGDQINFINGGGTGLTGKVLTVDSGTGEILTVSITNGGSGYTSIPTSSIISTNGSGAVITPVSNNVGKIKKIEFDNFGIGYTTLPTLDMTGLGDGNAVLTPVIGAMNYYSGRYITAENILGQDVRIQDGYYYQDFSYVIKSGVSINTYRDVLKKLVHPTGMVVFGEVTIEEKVKLNLYKGIPGRIDENEGRMFRCLVKHFSNQVTSSVLVGDNFNIVYNENFEQSPTTKNIELDRWMKFKFTSRTIGHVANLTIADYSSDPLINTNNYEQNMNIQPDLEVDYLLVDYINTESGNILNTEVLERLRT